MRRRRWTVQEIQMLRERYPDEGPNQLAQEMGRSADSVSSFAHRCGLRTQRWLERLDAFTPSPSKSASLVAKVCHPDADPLLPGRMLESPLFPSKKAGRGRLSSWFHLNRSICRNSRWTRRGTIGSTPSTREPTTFSASMPAGRKSGSGRAWPRMQSIVVTVHHQDSKLGPGTPAR